jgi:putative ABC transport system permease protein
MRDLRSWRRRNTRDDDVDREFEVHLALEAEEQLEAGVPLRDAKLAAQREFGSVALAKEELRDMRTGAALDRLGRELRHAARRLVRSPAFTLATVLTLALAIGANAAIFAVVHRVLLNPMPYAASNRLIQLDHGRRDVPAAGCCSTMTSRLYYQYRDRARTLDGLALYELTERTLTGQGDPERIGTARTTSSLARVLGVTAARGRWFTEDEAVPGASPVVVLSHGLWVRRFGADPAILGRVITLDNVPTMVVGVMPASYQFPDPRYDLWTPVPLTPATATDDYCCYGIARLRDGAVIADARAELTRLTTDLESTSPGHRYKELVSTATGLIEAHVGRVAADTLWILLASVGVVLLVACANVANLFLVRADARQREIAVRRALGSGSGGIAGFFLAESALLSIAGGAAGLGLAAGAIQLLVAFGPATLPRLEEVRLDAVVVAFTLALTVLTAVACGSIPLLRLPELNASLTESGRGNTASRGRHRARQLLMAGQVAMALILLVASGLMIRSYHELRAVDPGFDPTSALTFRIALPRGEYPDRGTVVAAHHAMLDRLAALPGATAVSASTGLPLSSFGNGGVLFVEGRSLPAGAAPLVAVRAVAGGYVETMGMRLLAGRAIGRRDIERNELVAVVNQALANLSFPNQDPIGQRLRLGSSSEAPAWLTIVGVVSNTPTNALAEDRPVPTLYMPMFTRDVGFGPRIETMSYVVRTASPLGLTAPARGAIGAVDPNLPLARVRTLQDILDRASAQMAFAMVLLAIAAGVALLLGMIGIYGVTSYIVSQRTGEIGVRLALGAEPGSVARMIVRQGGRVALAGVIAGLATAFLGGRLLESLLHGVSPRDPVVFVAATLSLLAVAFLACWLPARRAARLSPLEALRIE